MAKWADMTQREKNETIFTVVFGGKLKTQDEMRAIAEKAWLTQPRVTIFGLDGFAQVSETAPMFRQFIHNFTFDPAALELAKREVERRGWRWSIHNYRPGKYGAFIREGDGRDSWGSLLAVTDGPTEADAFGHAAVRACGWKEDAE